MSQCHAVTTSLGTDISLTTITYSSDVTGPSGCCQVHGWCVSFFTALFNLSDIPDQFLTLLSYLRLI
jgi:hypothetical protein